MPRPHREPFLLISLSLLLGLFLGSLNLSGAPESATVVLEKARQLERQGKYAEAVPLYSELIDRSPMDGTAYTKRGWCNYLLGKKAESFADLEMGVSLADDDPNAYFYRGICRKGEGEFAKASADFTQAAKLQPGEARIHYELAYCLMRSGKLAEALQAADSADRLKPNDSKTLALRSAIHEKSGHPTQALEDCEKALAACKDEKQRPVIEQARTRLAAAQSAVVASVAAPAKAGGAKNADEPAAPTPPAGLLDLNLLSAGQYNGAVSVAMEGIRLVRAPLSAAQTKKFEQQWAPMFHHPSAENITYLNRLNPLVQAWLALRSQLAEASAAYDKAIEEARFAAAYESEAGTQTAMGETGRLVEFLQRGKTRLAELGIQLQALGDPPDAAAGHRQRKAQHAEALQTVKRAAGLPEELIYLKIDFSRQPEGWVHELSGVGTEEWHPSVDQTLLPTEQRYAYLRPNDGRIAKMSGTYPDLDPRQYSYTDTLAWTEFVYRGSDLLDLGDISVKVHLAHARLDQAEDLAVHSNRPKPSFGTGTAAACRGPMVTYEDDSSRDEPWRPRYEAYQVRALDVGMSGEDYWVMVTVLGNCRNPVPSDNLPGEKALWEERSAILRPRIANRVQALLNSLEFQMVKEVPKTEPQRLKALQDFAKAHPPRPLSPADEARLTDWRRGSWTLRHGADPVPSLPQDIQSGNAGYSIFDDGKTAFRHTWTRPPPQLPPGAVIEFEITTENTKQDIHRYEGGQTSIQSRAAYASANWDDLADTRQSRYFDIETAFANSDPARGERRTNTRTKIPIKSPGPTNFTAGVEIGFTQPGGSAYAKYAVTYTYDWAWSLGPDNPAVPPSVLPAGLGGASPNLPPPSAEEIAQAEADKRWREARIAEIRENITFLNKCLAREQEELGRETDLSRKGAHEFRVLGLRSDILAEEDLIKSLDTGESVHTRSPFDEYAGAHFLQQCQTEAREASQMVRAVSAANRLTAMLPPAEAEKARAFIGRQLTPMVVGTHDVATARQALQAVKDTVQGHFEGVAAQGASEAAVAQFGLDAAENIKTAADTGMSACSLFGGQSVNLLYQAGTGYAEGGPRQALKAAATTWSDTIDYAVTAYDAYKEGGASSAAVAAGWKFAQNKAMGYLVGKMTGAGDHLTADPDRPLSKPTLQEQFDAAKFQQERGWGEALVKDFQRSQNDLMKAGGAGAAPEVIMKLQAAARDKAAAVASSLHAKNYLKYQADPAVGRAYDAHMGAVHAEADANLKDAMKQEKWNADEWELMEFRNASSYGKPNMDRDVGLRERPLWQLDDKGLPLKGADGRPVPNPEAWSTGPNGQPVPKPQLTKDGKPMTLDEWREEAQRLYNRAYRQASGGRSAEIAMEGITTSTHPEAYKDLLWLGQDKSAVSKVWAGQAGDVTRYKALHLLNKGDPSAAYFTKLQEVARGTAKDMDSKLLPLLKEAKPSSGSILRQSSPLSAAAIARSQAHWGEIQSVLQSFGRNDIDPITATRRIREITGGKSIPEVVDQMATLMESLVKGRRH